MSIEMGYGAYRNGTILAGAAGTATAGVRNRFAVSATVGEDLYDHLSGEFRYTYQDGDPFISAGGIETRIQGQSHAFQYDAMVHFRTRDKKIRPYAVAGAGAKLYITRSPGLQSQPLAAIGTLTTRDDPKFLAVFGFGAKMKLHEHVALRVDFLDYLTPFPKTAIKPAPFATARGIFQQFSPMAGVSYVF